MTTTGLYFHPYPRTGLDFSNGGLDKLAKAFFDHDVYMSEIGAQLTNGILSVKIPLAKTAQKHSIPIL